MQKGILGKKIGMTQLYVGQGTLVPVTLIEAGPCTILDVKETAKDRPVTMRLGFANKKENRTNKPDAGNFRKSGSVPKRFIREVRLDAAEGLNAGKEINADIFKEGEFVDVTGMSKGKGFQGGMKRWNWTAGKAGHGSMHHRRVGSIGASSFPSRVHKGKTMPGHLGFEKTTVQHLEILRVDKEQSIIAVKGTVPGHNSTYLIVRLSKKNVGTGGNTSLAKEHGKTK